jgi:dihydroorotate dehydrogenase (NAD+) catalytic subunit
LSLHVSALGLEFTTPLCLLSGNAGYGTEYLKVPGFNYDQVGAVFLKGTTQAERYGNPPERVVETPYGLMNAIGLQNPGAEAVIRELLPKLTWDGKPHFIPNISGFSIDEYAYLAQAFDQTPVPAIEINISCPNVKKGGAAFGNDPDLSAKVVQACRSVTSKPLIVKLSPNQTDIAQSARRCIDAGANALSAINTVSAMAIDIHTRKPRLGNNQGGLSGPAIKPIALLAVHKIYQVARAHNIPVIGQGGITNAEDAIEFMLAGATLIGVGTGLAKDPLIAKKIIKGINAYMDHYGFTHVSQLTGALELHENSNGCTPASCLHLLNPLQKD